MTDYGTCTLATNGQHAIEWINVPAHEHNGVEVSPAHRRGFCWTCDERFTD